MIKPGEEIHGSSGQRLRVVDVVLFDEEDEPRFVGLSAIESASFCSGLYRNFQDDGARHGTRLGRFTRRSPSS
jgi:hypothetical protein